jgi:acyl carrier protein
VESVLAKVREAFESAFGVDPQEITIDTGPKDIDAWDSMGHVTLASSLERAFNVSFDVDELMEMENVRAIVRILEGKLNEAG